MRKLDSWAISDIYTCKLWLVAALALGAIVCSPAAEAQGTGYWSTAGSRIVDANGAQIRISGVNWYGFETSAKVAHGLTGQDYHTILKTVRSLGYNTVRIPFSNDMVENSIVPSSISYSNGSGSINTDLQGLNSLQILDKIIAAAGQNGLKVILDNHRSEAGDSAEANGLWFTGAYPESKWIADWVTLTQRYSSYTDSGGNPTVIGMDLRNEPHNATSGGGCWTGDSNAGGCALSSPNNWPAAAQRAAASVHNVNPRLLIFVEGVDEYNNDWYWWGGNLVGANNNPVHLSVPNKLVYSAHDYGPHEYGQGWFNGSTTSSSLETVWTKFWAYLSLNGTTPVWVGEFGTTNNSADIQSSAAGSQGQWFSSLVSFLGNNTNISWTYWALNGEDAYGLLDSSYDSTPVNTLKQQQLSSIQSGQGIVGGPPPPSCSSSPAAPASAAASASSSTQIRVSWSAVTPTTNCTVSYSIFRGTVSGFTPSPSNQIASGLISTSFGDSGLNASTTYSYAVRAVDSFGSSPSALASATTSAPNPASAGCHIGYSVINQWPGGFQVALTIGNTGSAALTGWNLQWTFPGTQKISNLWNANWSQSGQGVTLTNVSYNGNIPAGGSYNGIGFTGSFSDSNSVPSNFVLNGNPCN